MPVRLSYASAVKLSELSTEVEGIKLDVTIAEREIEVNKSAISKVESNLHEINSGYEDLRLQFDEYKKITEVLIQRDRFQYSTTFEYSNVIDKVNPSETKRYQDEVSRLKKDLSSEREKSKRLEADLSILIKEDLVKLMN